MWVAFCQEQSFPFVKQILVMGARIELTLFGGDAKDLPGTAAYPLCHPTEDGSCSFKYVRNILIWYALPSKEQVELTVEGKANRISFGQMECLDGNLCRRDERVIHIE